MDLASSYINKNLLDSALFLYDTSLQRISSLKAERKYIDIIAAQLSWLSSLPQKQDEAKKRLAIIRQHLDLDTIYNVASSLGHYYVQYGPYDSAALFNKKALATTTKLGVKRSTARRLASLYHQMGLIDSCLRYAQLYMLLNDSLIKQQNADETQLVQNEFEYRRNKEAEEEAYRQAAEAKEKLMGLGIVALSALTLLLIILWQREKRARREIDMRDEKIETQNSQMSEKDRELEELSSQIELKLKKMEAAELDTSELLEMLRKKAAGHQVGKTKRELFMEVFAAIDQTYPNFAQQLHMRIPDISKNDLTLAYMHQLGLTNTEIANLVGLDRSNVHRHLKALGI